ncbi:transcriptional regulator domain-containing protein [Paraburkholderia sp. GAS334]|uniref:transcriptional regulator domain-containing protein n=1 Tax=Paraburkholderia sp. GAS334 TaxID=3035131 RepID=UPI003D1AD459
MPSVKHSKLQRDSANGNGKNPDAASKNALECKAFPDGMDLNDYQGYERWSNRQWAWEFLRRNEKFRTACIDLGRIAVESDEYKKKSRSIAKNFKLRHFVHYTTPFKDGKDGPWFNPTRIWSKIPSGASSRTVNVQIRKGQVVVRFDLLPALEDERIIKAQIHYAELALEAQLAKLLESDQAKRSGRRDAEETPEERLAWLRTLDAKFCNVPHSKIYEQVYPEHCQNTVEEGVDKREWPIRLKSLARKAHELADGRYLGLALPKTQTRSRSKSSRTAK